VSADNDLCDTEAFLYVKLCLAELLENIGSHGSLLWILAMPFEIILTDTKGLYVIEEQKHVLSGQLSRGMVVTHAL